MATEFGRGPTGPTKYAEPADTLHQWQSGEYSGASEGSPFDPEDVGQDLGLPERSNSRTQNAKGAARVNKGPLVCMVTSCGKDLSEEKTYFQRHRVCETHLKLLSLVVGGTTCRFCQQCGKFHPLTEFDGSKRSCRARLAKHNARRRRNAAGELDEEPHEPAIRVRKPRHTQSTSTAAAPSGPYSTRSRRDTARAAAAATACAASTPAAAATPASAPLSAGKSSTLDSMIDVEEATAQESQPLLVTENVDDPLVQDIGDGMLIGLDSFFDSDDPGPEEYYQQATDPIQNLAPWLDSAVRGSDCGSATVARLSNMGLQSFSISGDVASHAATPALNSWDAYQVAGSNMPELFTTSAPSQQYTQLLQQQQQLSTMGIEEYIPAPVSGQDSVGPASAANSAPLPLHKLPGYYMGNRSQTMSSGQVMYGSSSAEGMPHQQMAPQGLVNAAMARMGMAAGPGASRLRPVEPLGRVDMAGMQSWDQGGVQAYDSPRPAPDGQGAPTAARLLPPPARSSLQGFVSHSQPLPCMNPMGLPGPLGPRSARDILPAFQSVDQYNDAASEMMDEDIMVLGPVDFNSLLEDSGLNSTSFTSGLQSQPAPHHQEQLQQQQQQQQERQQQQQAQMQRPQRGFAAVLASKLMGRSQGMQSQRPLAGDVMMEDINVAGPGVQDLRQHSFTAGSGGSRLPRMSPADLEVMSSVSMQVYGCLAHQLPASSFGMLKELLSNYHPADVVSMLMSQAQQQVRQQQQQQQYARRMWQ